MGKAMTSFGGGHGFLFYFCILIRCAMNARSYIDKTCTTCYNYNGLLCNFGYLSKKVGA